MLKRCWEVFDRLVYSILKVLCSAAGKDYTDRQHGLVMQFVKFCFVGVLNAVVYYSVYVGTLLMLRRFGLFSVWDYEIAQIAGFAVSVFAAFCINRKLVFTDHGTEFLRPLLRFYLSYAFTGLFLNSVLLYLWTRLGISEFIGPVINIFISTPLNFVLNKLWTFRGSGEKKR